MIQQLISSSEVFALTSLQIIREWQNCSEKSRPKVWTNVALRVQTSILRGDFVFIFNYIYVSLWHRKGCVCVFRFAVLTRIKLKLQSHRPPTWSWTSRGMSSCTFVGWLVPLERNNNHFVHSLTGNSIQFWVVNFDTFNIHCSNNLLASHINTD